MKWELVNKVIGTMVQLARQHFCTRPVRKGIAEIRLELIPGPEGQCSYFRAVDAQFGYKRIFHLERCRQISHKRMEECCADRLRGPFRDCPQGGLSCLERRFHSLTVNLHSSPLAKELE